MAYVIQRTDDVQPLFYSDAVGWEQASPLGGWSDQRERATLFASDDGAREFLKEKLRHMEPFCEVKPL